jgi:hypothetical protein
MSRPTPENLDVQLVCVDHECLFASVLYAYEKVARKGADRAMLHRAVLSLGFKPDSDEINRLRQLQRRLREVGAPAPDLEALELQISSEYGTLRSAQALAGLPVEAVRDWGVRWSVVGKRGPPIRISPELIGLLSRLYPDHRTHDGFPAFVEGSESPADATGRAVFPPPGTGDFAVYRPPDSVVDAYKALSFIDRPTLDRAVTEVVGSGPDAEETATWLEADFEALTSRYETAASKRLGIEYRFS